MYLILGARGYKFEDPETKKEVEGVTVWIADDQTPYSTGWIPFKASYSNENFEKIFGGFKNLAAIHMKPVSLSFNRFGKPDSYTLLEKEK